MLICNARVLNNEVTGVPRYLLELTSRFGAGVELIRPKRPSSGIAGHLWDQTVLPRLVGGNLLWSPANSGPLAVSRQVVTIHDLVHLDHPEWVSSRYVAWYRFLTPRLVSIVRRIIVVSEFTKQCLLNHCPQAESKVDVVLSAADSRFSPQGETCVSSVARELNLPSRHYILALGSLEPRKNLNRVLQAWKRVAPSVPDDIWLLVVGASGRRTVFGEWSYEELPPRVHFTGHVKDSLLPGLYSGALLAVYASLYEGFGLPPLEAMACGIPVITSNVASLPEVVGDAAFTVNPLDVDAIADGLRTLIEDRDLRQRLSSRGLIRSKRFSWDKTATRILQILKAANE